METTLQKRLAPRLADKAKEVIVDIITYLFVVLFVYTATDKFWKIESFQIFMSRLDLFHYTGKYVALMIPSSEVFISVLLLIHKTRRLGMFLSLSLMTVFTAYLIYMKLTAEVLPCHCGGAISSLSWVQHIWFNIILILMSVAALILDKKTE